MRTVCAAAVVLAAGIGSAGAVDAADLEITNFKATRVAQYTYIISGDVVNANLDYCAVGLSGLIEDMLIPDEYGHFAGVYTIGPATTGTVYAIAEDYDEYFNPRYSDEVDTVIDEP